MQMTRKTDTCLFIIHKINNISIFFYFKIINVINCLFIHMFIYTKCEKIVYAAR